MDSFCTVFFIFSKFASGQYCSTAIVTLSVVLINDLDVVQ